MARCSRDLAVVIASLWLWLAPDSVAVAKPRRTAASTPITPVLVPQIGNFKGISSLTYSSDGKTLATVSEDYGPLLIWDAATLELKRTLHGQGTSGQVLFTPDPNLLAINTGGANAFAVHLLDVRSGEIVRKIPSARYLDNGRVLARYSKTRVTFSEARTGRRLLTLALPAEGYGTAPNAFYFSPNHKRLALDTGAEVKVFDVPRTSPRLTLSDPRGEFGKQAGVFGPVAFSPDGKLIATGGEDPNFHVVDDDGPNTEAKYAHSLTVKVWDARTGKLRRVLPNYGYSLGSRVGLLRFSPDSRRLLIGAEYNTDLLDLQSFKVLRRTKASAPFAIAPNGVHLLSGGYYGQHAFGTLSDLRTGRDIKNLPAALGVIGVYAWSKDGHWLMAGDGHRNEVRLWNVREGKSGPSWKRHNPILGGFLPDGTLWTADLHEAEIRDPETGKLLDSFKTPVKDTWGSRGISVSPDGRFFITQRYLPDSPVELYDVKTKSLALSLSKPGLEVGSVVFSSDGQKLAAVATSSFKPSLLYVWNIKGELLHTFSDADETSKETIYIYGPRFSPDGTQLFAQGTRGLRVYDLATGEKRMLETKTMTPFDFSADGQWRVSSSNSLTEISDASTNQILHRFTAPTYFDAAAALSPDKKILARAEGGRTMLYEVSTGRKLLTLVSLPIHDETKAPVHWLAYTPDGFYNASPGAAAQIRWRVGDTLYPAEKFERQFQQGARLKAIIASARKH
jgi:WD40 repeat protein